jgi:glycosyltransferase involved in cell wall biosynthesis
MRIAVFSLDIVSYACAQVRLIRPFFYLYPELKYKWCVQSDGNNYAISYDALDWADLIIVQRYFPIQETWPCIEKILDSGKPVVYEIDDLLWQVPASNPLAFNMEKTRPYILKLLPLVQAVTVSTSELAEKIKPFNANVFVFPNLLDPRLWDMPLPDRTGSLIKIGFAGSQTHQSDLEMIEGAMVNIIDRFKERLEVLLFGCATKRLLRCPSVRVVPFEQGYVRFVKRLFSLNLDIGLAPLEDNEFNRCKSNIKWLEYSACAVPGIYSDLSPYAKDIQSGKDGLLVGSSEKEWIEALEFLICNEKERIKMGYMARKRIMHDFILGGQRDVYLSSYRRFVCDSFELNNKNDRRCQ